MLKTSIGITSILLAATIVAAKGQKVVTLAAGTPVFLAASRNISSATDRVGDSVTFEVVENVLADGIEVISKNALIPASVVASRPLQSGRKGSTLTLKLSEFQTASGVKLRLGLTPPLAGRTTVVSTAGASPLPIVFEGTPSYTTYTVSADAFVSRGFRVTAYVLKTAVLDASKLHPATIVPVVAVALTNEDVIALFRMGKSEKEIVAAIQSSPGQYRTGADDIAALKKAGLTSRIIEAMLAATH